MAYPQYVKPMGTYGPGGIKYGQYSDWFKENPYQNQYAGLLGRLGNYSGQLMGRRLANDPLAAGGMFGDPSKFRSTFGYATNAISPDNPNLPRWMSQLRGGQQNLLNQQVGQMANASMASSRGGMGVMGGANPRAQMAQNASGQLAGRYADDFSKAVEWERQRAMFENQAADAMARGYSSIYNTDMSTAANLLGQELQGTKYSADDLARYQQAMLGAYMGDTDWYNQQVKGRPEERWQERQRRWTTKDRMGQKMQEDELGQLMRQLYFNPQQFGSWENYIGPLNYLNDLRSGKVNTYGRIPR